MYVIEKMSMRPGEEFLPFQKSLVLVKCGRNYTYTLHEYIKTLESSVERLPAYVGF